jgi:hypothetical protein
MAQPEIPVSSTHVRKDDGLSSTVPDQLWTLGTLWKWTSDWVSRTFWCSTQKSTNSTIAKCGCPHQWWARFMIQWRYRCLGLEVPSLISSRRGWGQPLSAFSFRSLPTSEAGPCFNEFYSTPSNHWVASVPYLLYVGVPYLLSEYLINWRFHRPSQNFWIMSYSFQLPSGTDFTYRVDYTSREVKGVRVSNHQILSYSCYCWRFQIRRSWSWLHVCRW